MLEAGKKAPLFSAYNQKDEKISLQQFLGKRVCLFFYPEDFSPTCTVEACHLQSHWEVLQKHNIEIIGISCDTSIKHKKFAMKYNLQFQLLSDTESNIQKKYEVWDWKKFMGKTYIGCLRSTFLINAKGKIDGVIYPVKSKIQIQQIQAIWTDLSL